MLANTKSFLGGATQDGGSRKEDEVKLLDTEKRASSSLAQIINKLKKEEETS